MNGGRLQARQARKRKRNRARAENIAIVVLAALALFLAGQTGMIQNTLPALGNSQTVEGGYTVGPAVSLTGASPVRLVLRNGAVRYGVEYDPAEVDRLYREGLADLLDQGLRTMDAPVLISEEDWQGALTASDRWAFYDFLNNIVFDQQNTQGSGAGRFFLVTGRGGEAEEIFFYNEAQRHFYRARIRESVRLPDGISAVQSNGARFAFEDQAVAEVLSPYMLVLDDPPACPVFTAADPLAELDDQGWDDLLESLSFNAKAASPYTTATGSVIREGTDTLRVMNDGTIQFHGSETGEARYVALSERHRDLQMKAEEILDRATVSYRGPARFLCRSVRTLEDGQTELIYSYLLNGARVQMWGEGWGARFLFRGSTVSAYTILTRSYEAGDRLCPLLPVRQAAAAASAMGRRGSELQVTYQDDGGQQAEASWTVREPR